MHLQKSDQAVSPQRRSSNRPIGTDASIDVVDSHKDERWRGWGETKKLDSVGVKFPECRAN